MTESEKAAPDAVRTFARRLRGNADRAEALKFSVANLSTLPIADCRALADWMDSAMQEAMAQGGEPTPKQLRDAYAYSDLICPTTHNIEAEILGVWRFLNGQVARPAPEVKDAPGFERCADCGGSGMYWAGEDVRPCPECNGDTVVPTTPAPAAADEVVEALEHYISDFDRRMKLVEPDKRPDRWSEVTGVAVDVLRDAKARIEALQSGAFGRWCARLADKNKGLRARIEAYAAEMERKDARIAELERKLADTLGACKRLGERATAAEAERDALREALAEIANAYTAHGYSDAMDAVQNLKDIAKGALK